MHSRRHSKELSPIPQFKVTAKLGKFRETRFSQWFYQGAVTAGRPRH
jgi:hypothetical protein